MEENIYPRPGPYNVIAYPLLGGYFYDELIKKIDMSKLFIYVVQYQWKWNVHLRFSKVQQLGDAILRARKRGVEVKVVLNQESPRRNLTKINSVTGDQLARAGCLVKMLQTSGLVHTKLWICDGIYTFVGSHNISARSLSVNEETSVLIESPQFAVFMTKYFDNLFKIV